MILPAQDLPPDRSESEGSDGSEVGLLLRVRGGENHGRLVRLNRRKCTIGSSRSCSLRLVSNAFRPVHCVIVRGRHGTIVRRWSDETYVNGAVFDDHWLTPGDRLGVHNIELEVISDRLPARDRATALIGNSEISSGEDESTEPQSPVAEIKAEARSADAARHVRRLYRQRVRGLCRRLREAARQAEQLHRDVVSERDRVAELQTQLDQLQAAATVDTPESVDWDVCLRHLAQQFDETLAGDDRSQHRIGRCREAIDLLRKTQHALEQNQQLDLDDESGEFDAGIADLEAELNARQQNLDEQFRNLIQQQQALMEKEDQFEEIRQELEHWLEERDTAEAEFSQRQEAFEQQNQAVQASIDQQRQQIQEEHAQLRQQRADLESLATQQQAASEQQTEPDEAWQQRCDQLITVAEELQDEVEKLRGMLAEQTALCDQLNSKAAGYESELERHAEQHRQAAQALQQRIDDLESEVRLLTAERDSLAHDTKQTGEFESLAADLQKQLEQTQVEQASLENQLRQVINERDELRATDAQASVVPQDTPAKSAAVSAADVAPDSVVIPRCDEDVVAEHRVPNADDGAADAAEKTEPPPGVASQIPDADEVVFSTPPSSSPTDTASILARYAPNIYEGEGDDASAPPANELEPTTPDPSPPSIDELDDESEGSIEDYMADLMRRVGSGNPLAKQAPISVVATEQPVAPEPTALLPKEPPVATPQPMGKDQEFKPRAQEPIIDLSAMRDVANTTARRDISRHEHRQRLQEAYLHWCLAASAFCVGGALVYWSREFLSLTALQALIGFSAGAFWAVRGFACFRSYLCGKKHVRKQKPKSVSQ